MRRVFDGRTYFTFQQCENAMRAQRINAMLDAGTRVWGDDGPDEKGTEYELDEAPEPHSHGITCRTKCGRNIKIFAYDASDSRQTVSVRTPG